LVTIRNALKLEEEPVADKYNSKIASLVGWMNKAKGGYAVTISSACTLYSVPQERVNPQWRLHEDCHKAQITCMGWFAFMYDYLRQSLAFGYMDNKYEVEARRAADGQL
jgi:hypothetical protein